MPVLYLKSKQSHLNLNLFPDFILTIFAFVSIQINMNPCFSSNFPLFLLCKKAAQCLLLVIKELLFVIRLCVRQVWCVCVWVWEAREGGQRKREERQQTSQLNNKLSYVSRLALFQWEKKIFTETENDEKEFKVWGGSLSKRSNDEGIITSKWTKRKKVFIMLSQ